MNYTTGDIAYLMDASLNGASDYYITHISIDSRSLITPVARTIFIALEGNIVDGHDYVKAAYDKGVRVFLVHKKISLPIDAITIEVDSTLSALQHWAIKHRDKFDIPIIAITGSNGKTITKEWLSKLLSKHYKVIKSPKSYNSQIGVPLSILRLDDTHEIGIFEAGISQPNEMKYIEKIIQPSICILTNIGDAHSSGFKGEGYSNLKLKLIEKAELFKNANEIIYYSGDGSNPYIINELDHIISQEKRQPYSYRKIDNNKILFEFYGKTIELDLPFYDEASIQNILASLSAMCLLGIDISTLGADLMNLNRLNMRMETKSGKWGSTLINDAYSSDLQSLDNAVQYLKQIKAIKPIIVLSDLEDNEEDDRLYPKVAEILNRIDHILITVGKSSEVLQKLVTSHINHFETTNDVKFNRKIIEGRTILLKGARNYKFEKFYKQLSAQSHSAYMEIDLSAMEHNLSVYASMIPSQTKIMTVVKASAYGSGAKELAKHLQHRQVAYMAVAYVDEGIQLRESGIQTPILVFNPDLDQVEEMINYNLEPEIYSLEQLERIIQDRKQLSSNNLPAIHIKLDTGMHRLGFQKQDLVLLIPLLKEAKLRVASIFSHLASSDNEEHEIHTMNQYDEFVLMANLLSNALEYKPLRHLANTSAITKYPILHLDMVRLGLGLYGIDNDSSTSVNLERVHTLIAKIIQVKKLTKGETVGYNRGHILKRDSRIAIINIGYADGLMRNSGNSRHKVRMKNKLIPIIGNVCMDLSMIDITDISDVKIGDEVEIFGKEVDIRVLADINDTIPYELLAGISTRVKKVYVRR